MVGILVTCLLIILTTLDHHDKDNQTSLDTFRKIISRSEYHDGIPRRIVEKIKYFADHDCHRCNIIYMIQNPFQLRPFCSHFFHNSRGKHRAIPYCTLIITTMQLMLYICDSIGTKNPTDFGLIARYFIYAPQKRYQLWRYLTYMFVHLGTSHVLGNLLTQVGVGILLEVLHGSQRLWVIYMSGVIAGSLGTSIVSPTTSLAGASCGITALVAAYTITLFTNWPTDRYAIYKMCPIPVIILLDLSGPANKIRYLSHIFGTTAGLLVSITILNNWGAANLTKKVIRWSSLIIYFFLMGAAIIFSVSYPSYFPKQR